jgi:hypothetical protein
MQFYNCQQFNHVWTNCKQTSPRCSWCVGSHLNKECSEKGNASSTPACCNCQLAEREKAHPSNYRGCKHAKEMLILKSQRTPTASKLITPGVFRGGSRKQQQRPHPLQVTMAGPATMEPWAAASSQQEQQVSGPSVLVPNVNSLPLNSTLREVTVQPIMTEFNGAVS